jgi:hypothetical protein
MCTERNESLTKSADGTVDDSLAWLESGEHNRERSIRMFFRRPDYVAMAGCGARQGSR